MMDLGDAEGPTQRQAGGDGPPSRAAMAKNDLEAVLLLTEINPKCAVFVFWMENKRKFAEFSLVAFSVLGAVGTSAESERDFSAARNFITNNRSTMLTQHLEMDCMIRICVNLLPTPLLKGSTMTGEEVHKIKAKMPLSRRRQVEGDQDNLSSDEHSADMPYC